MTTIPSIQSEINRITAELNQLDDLQFYSNAEAERRRPALQAQLVKLEKELNTLTNNLEISE